MTENIYSLTPIIEHRIKKNPLLNLDTFIIPSPYVRDTDLEKDYNHSCVWIEEREILGYMLVYSNIKRKKFHIYKIVVSPFGRGRGIGQAFIKHLAESVSDGSEFYLYLWEKQTDTLDFFTERGFRIEEPIVYRNLVYYLILGPKKDLLDNQVVSPFPVSEAAEIGKTRHDARKIVRLLSHMVDSLSSENCDKIVEDINRESTTLINMLNFFRDSRKVMHEVNLRDLIIERIVPFVQASPIKCCLQIKLNTKNTTILGHHENITRALINIVSNSLDAIEEKGIKGAIKISLAELNGEIILSIRDNGIGIEPELLKKDETGVPLFVGKTTKKRKEGEGLGTVQIFSIFGSENITITSSPAGTGWKIKLQQSGTGMDQHFIKMQRRFDEFKNLLEKFSLNDRIERNETIKYIWQLRKMEIFLYDLILMFSNYNNIRIIYRTILGYIYGNEKNGQLKKYIFSLKSERQFLPEWMFEIVKEIKVRNDYLKTSVSDFESFRGAMLKSYGQAIGNVIIFTMDPETGNFLASDRKLAEHLDFVQYLGKPRDMLLRGEFTGDINNDEKSMALGVWSIESEEDLVQKLVMMRDASSRLIEMGIHRDKKLDFYQTTYPKYNRDINSDMSSTLGEFSSLNDSELMRYIRESEKDDFDFLMQVD